MQLLKYTYRYRRVAKFDISLRRKKEDHYPMLPCRFRSTTAATDALYGLLDSGSEGISIPKILSEQLALDPREAEPIGVVGGTARRGVVTVVLIIGSQGRYTEFKDVEVSVTLDEEVGPVILGRAPIFKYYDITFSDADLKVALNPHRQKSKNTKKRTSKRI
jgi:hypothetical protein